MKTYLETLVEQYERATNDKETLKYIQEKISDFAAFYKKRQAIGDEYFKLLSKTLQSHNIAAEIEKGSLDTLSSHEQIRYIITNNINGILETHKVLNGEVLITDDDLYLKQGKTLLSLADNVDTIILSNPYTTGIIRTLPYLPDQNKRFVIGAYGDKHDKDKDEKIDQIKTVYNYTDKKDIKEEYQETDDNYFYLIQSKKNKIRKRNV